VFEGDFRHGKYDGDGKTTFLSGLVLTAQYRGGLLDGPFTLRLSDGGLLRSQFRYGNAEGVWSLVGQNGQRKEWQLKDGVPKELEPLLKGL
jgi:hypothetical protein